SDSKLKSHSSHTGFVIEIAFLQSLHSTIKTSFQMRRFQKSLQDNNTENLVDLKISLNGDITE
ncbi:hypothetical protein, partial [Desulfobacula sp.]|uniref:hypothetical protein n=1 Tax=Desulfobacula sp. TaxID=2593537 RepID=UPI002714B412